MASVFKKVKYKALQQQYQHNAYDKAFDWDWDAVPYNRIALVNLLTAQIPQCDYLEIGCFNNALFYAVCAANKTGVDPVRGGNVRKTSDEFFANNTRKFDVIFIDGLHEYPQVRRDVVNAIKFLKPGGWIAMHDMLPRNWLEHHVPMIKTGPWSGDGWKVGFELANTPGIDFKILRIDHGVGVFKLTQPNPTLIDREAEMQNKQFSYLYENISSLPVVEWQDSQDWLRGR